MTFWDERYEALTAAIAFIDAAVEMLDGFEDHDELAPKLNDARNDLNIERISLLGGGRKKPWHVSDIVEEL